MLDRNELEAAHSISLTDKDAGPLNGCISFSHPIVMGTIMKAGFVLRPLRVQIKSLQTLLRQTSGIFLVEIFWKNACKAESSTQDFHVIAVNCDWRLVFCNTLGIIPFADTAKNKESAESAHIQFELFIFMFERYQVRGFFACTPHSSRQGCRLLSHPRAA